MDGGFAVSETDVRTVQLAAAARKLTDTIARCQAAIAMAEENIQRAELALATAEQRLRRAHDMQARSVEQRQQVQQGRVRMNNAGHVAARLRTGLAAAPEAGPGRESGTQRRESA